MLSKNSYSLIINFEVGGGKTYFDKFLKSGNLPGGDSGVTILVGVDCGYTPVEELKLMIWDYVTEDDFNLLVGAQGLKKEKAKAYLPKVKHIEFEWEKALQVFDDFTIPKWYKIACDTYPGLSECHPDCIGSLVSLTFNRGSSLEGPRRKEMRDIVGYVKTKDYQKISRAILAMKRLWTGTDIQDGMYARREAEAKLVASCS